ncbi:MAG: radical SAM protein [Coriobacteriia bacterium]|nr:radical SAM protein [Coriobacteriia bacterium]
MISERLQSSMVRYLNKRYLSLQPTTDTYLPKPRLDMAYMLYAHIPFCERLCPYCSFNRYLFEPGRALSYFSDLRREMQMLAELGYDFESLYIGGGTPTIMPDELFATIDQARELFSIREVSCETNPNHLTDEVLDGLQGRVQRLSCGVQSFDDTLLGQMERYEKYGSGEEVFNRILAVKDRFTSFNIDMIFNFPSQTEAKLINDIAAVMESGANQVTFYPLMASPAVSKSLAATVGSVDYRREHRYYEIISEALTGGSQPEFGFSSAWTFNRIVSPKEAFNYGEKPLSAQDDLTGLYEARAPMVDEYIVNYEEYPAIGSGGLSYLDGSLFVNTFSLDEYHRAILAGQMSVSGKTDFTKLDRMRYRFMMQLFGLRLDKEQWQKDFACSVANGVPMEYLFFKTNQAFAHEDEQEITLSARGRYLMVALMREFFIGVNGVRDQARAALTKAERDLLFGD